MSQLEIVIDAERIDYVRQNYGTDPVVRKLCDYAHAALNASKQQTVTIILPHGTYDYSRDGILLPGGRYQIAWER